MMCCEMWFFIVFLWDLMLFTEGLGESVEDKYVDLLPDAEKQQFIENVARRILKDVETQANRTKVASVELSDEQLKKHDEYVKKIMKEETENARNKNEQTTEGQDSQFSDEDENLDVKPLESEKMAVADDPDIEQVDFTMRSDRREIVPDSDRDVIKIEIVTDEVPIFKRSIQNKGGSFESDSKSSEAVEKVETKTEDSNHIDTSTVTNKSEYIESTTIVDSTTEAVTTTETISTSNEAVTTTTEPVSSTTETSAVPTRTAQPKHEDSGSISVENKTETSWKIKPIPDAEIKKSKTNNETSSTTLSDGIELAETKLASSGDIDDEEVKVKGLEDPWARKSNDKSESEESIEDNNKETTSAVEFFGVKSKETKSDENSNVSGSESDSEELSTSIPADNSTDTTTNASSWNNASINTTDSSTKITTTDPPSENQSATDESTEKVDEVTKSTSTTKGPVVTTDSALTEKVDKVTEISASTTSEATTEPETTTTEQTLKFTLTTDEIYPAKDTDTTFVPTTEETTQTDTTFTSTTVIPTTTPTTTVPVTTEQISDSTANPLDTTTEEMKIIVERFTSAPRLDRTDSPTTKRVKTTTQKNDVEMLDSEIKPRAIKDEEDSTVVPETTTVKETTTVTDTTTVTEPPKVTESPEVTESSKTTESSKVIESLKVTESSKVEQSSETVGSEEVTEPTTVAELPEDTESSTVTKSPKVTKKPKSKKRPEVTENEEAPLLDKIETTTIKVKHKLIFHKYEKSIKGPKKVRDRIKGKKSKKDDHRNNFIELEKVYYDKNYKTKMGKYHVFEIPADKPPFTQNEALMSDQPYYVPIYNYSPNHAYFNPLNRLGPNADDASQEIQQSKVGAFTLDDDASGEVQSAVNDNIGTHNIDMEYSDTAADIKRKRFGNRHDGVLDIYNTRDIDRSNGLIPDYTDPGYYFGRYRKDFERRANLKVMDQFPNSDENDHPVHSIQDSSLKDHMRAVRNILIHQKFFGILNRDLARGKSELRQRLRSRPKKGSKKTVNRTNKKLKMEPLSQQNDGLIRSQTNNKNKEKSNDNDKNIAIDYYFGRTGPTAVITDVDKKSNLNNTHFQKVGYLRNSNNTKELYVMDEFFKNSVAKYIKELNEKDSAKVKDNDIQPVTPLPPPSRVALSLLKDAALSNFRQAEKKRNSEMNRNVSQTTDNKQKKIVKITEDQGTIKFSVDDNNDSLKDVNTVNEKDRVEIPVKLDLPINHNSSANLNMRSNRRNGGVKVKVYLQVLRDMINTDNRALLQYDWLGTTVDIQSSLQKLFELVSLVLNEEDIHPSDMEILKYTVFLHKLASEIIEANEFGTKLRKKLRLPRNKRKKSQPRLIKEKGLMNRVWLYLRKEDTEENDERYFKKLNNFLMDIEDNLFELHDAIKNIAKITKYKNQHWYKNLKELYLNTDENHLLELLLHLTVTRLFDMIEESAKTGLEDDYIQYMKREKKESKKTLEEMIFVMNIIDEINKNVE